MLADFQMCISLHLKTLKKNANMSITGARMTIGLKISEYIYFNVNACNTFFVLIQRTELRLDLGRL